MKRVWLVILLLMAFYFVGMLFYEYGFGANLSPKNCSCSYEVGESFLGSMVVTEIKKDTCVTTNICNRGYCIIEYSDPKGLESFSQTVLCE
ncbi:MAG: hypothetical protein ACP5N7_06100 [Candidatus Pacearchaeota archaeon]